MKSQQSLSVVFVNVIYLSMVWFEILYCMHSFLPVLYLVFPFHIVIESIESELGETTHLLSLHSKAFTLKYSKCL